MIERYLRPTYQRLFVERVAHLALSLSPTCITLLGCAFGVAAASLIGLGWRGGGLMLLLLSGYCDTLDGTVARLGGKTSPFGTALDIVCDRIVEFSVILSFMALYQAPYLTLFMLGSTLICVTSFLIVSLYLDEKSEKGFAYSRGLIERAEAFLFFAAMIVFPIAFPWLALLYTALVLLTALLRLIAFKTIVGDTI